jgi:hypothetical protein
VFKKWVNGDALIGSLMVEATKSKKHESPALGWAFRESFA